MTPLVLTLHICARCGHECVRREPFLRPAPERHYCATEPVKR